MYANINDKKFQFHINSPLVKSHELTQRNKKAGYDADVYIKLDNCQPSGSFKLRGIGHYILKHHREQKVDRIVCSSVGNAGLAAAYSAFQLNIRSTIFVPKTASQMVVDQLKSYNAEVIVHGNIWAEADVEAHKLVEKTQALYVPPFDHEYIWEGNSTMVDEIEEQLNQYSRDANNNLMIPDCIIGSVGGGGLLLGLIEGIRRRGWFEKKKDLKLVAVETFGADCFYQSVKQQKHVTLDSITSIAKALGALTCVKQLYDYYQQYKENIISLALPDVDAVDGCLKFLDHHKIFVEPACGVSIAVAYDLKKYLPEHKFKNVLVIVCGGKTLELADLLKLKEQFNL